MTTTALAALLDTYRHAAVTEREKGAYFEELVVCYRARFADNLAKELPRIPCVKSAADFWAFSRAGRALAELHVGYETVAPYPVKIDTGGKRLTDADYRVEKMRYGKKGKEKDLTTLHYNDTITLTGIPLEAYDYVVNGKPALDWVGGASVREDRQSQRHRQRRQRLGHRNHGQPQVPPGAVPARDHRQPGNPQDREGLAHPGHLTATVAHRATNPDDTARLPIHAAPRLIDLHTNPVPGLTSSTRMGVHRRRATAAGGRTTASVLMPAAPLAGATSAECLTGAPGNRVSTARRGVLAFGARPRCRVAEADAESPPSSRPRGPRATVKTKALPKPIGKAIAAVVVTEGRAGRGMGRQIMRVFADGT